MLAKFRYKKIRFLSFYLAIFALLVETMVPLAHANNISSSDESGFFASLCTSNGIVLIDLAINSDKSDSKQVPSISVDNECPLCNILEQDTFGIATRTNTSTFETASQQYAVPKQTISDKFLFEILTIRAPPYFLSA